MLVILCAPEDLVYDTVRVYTQLGARGQLHTSYAHTHTIKSLSGGFSSVIQRRCLYLFVKLGLVLRIVSTIKFVLLLAAFLIFLSF